MYRAEAHVIYVDKEPKRYEGRIEKSWNDASISVLGLIQADVDDRLLTVESLVMRVFRSPVEPL